MKTNFKFVFRLGLVFFLTIVTISLTQAQVTKAAEICNNGKDDDGDGLIDCADPDCAASSLCEHNCKDGVDNDKDGFVDCFDSDCSNDSACNGGFLNNNVNCQAKPTSFPKFSIKQKYTPVDNTTNHLNRVSVGDLDGDTYPELVVTEIENDKINILDGRTGAVKKTKNAGYSLNRDVLIGRVLTTGSKHPSRVFTSEVRFIPNSCKTCKDSHNDYYIYAYD